MKFKKRLLITILVLCTFVLFSGCKKAWKPTDAENYVKSMLDTYYKAEFDDYAKIVGGSVAEVQELYEENLDNVCDSFLAASGNHISDDTLDQFRQLFADLFKLTKYTIDGSQKDGDSFIVNVTIEPLNILENLQEELTEEVQNNTEALSAFTTQEEVTNWVFQKTCDIISEKMKTPAYNEPQSFPIHVTLKDGLYTADQEDVTALDLAMIPSQY